MDFSGYRNIPAEKEAFIRAELRREILAATKDGYTHFISGFAAGIDLIFADVVVQLQEESKEITLEAAIAYRNQLKSKEPLFCKLLPKCSIVGVLAQSYSKDCILNKNWMMVQSSLRVIAVCDGRVHRDSFSAIRSAHLLQRDIKIIFT